MKNKIFPLLASGLLALSVVSCKEFDDDVNRPDDTNGTLTALVTVCPVEDGSFFMQLDDSTRLNPVNVKTAPFGQKEVRAILTYRNDGNYTADDRVREVTVSSLDSIRTKRPVAWLGNENDMALGHDPIEIVNDWVTVAEDGYLTLRVRTRWGNNGVIHDINLVTGVNPDNPYEVELRHNAHGDLDGAAGDALVAFNLRDIVAQHDDPVMFKLRWWGFFGENSVDFILRKNRSASGLSVEGVTCSGRVK